MRKAVLLNGEFIIKKNKRSKKYEIFYLEDGVEILCPMLEFDSIDAANEHIDKHLKQLEDYVMDVIQEQIKREEEKEKKRKEKEEKKAKNKDKKGSGVKGFIAGVLAATVTLVGGHFVAKGISASIEDDRESITTTNNDKDKDVDNEINNVTTTTDNSISSDIENIIIEDEELSVENFTALVADFARPYVDNMVAATTEDLTKFVSIVNIDKLVEENSEFASELFATQTKEEYLGDAAKVIGITYTYNRNVFEKEGSTENFIRISESVYGPQKEKLQIVEGYVDKIALAKNDATETNRLVTELLTKLGDPTSELSYLDDGVGFGMQVSIELIRSYLAKDVLNKENKDMLTVLTSSEEYVSNIFTTYDKCLNTNSKTR